MGENFNAASLGNCWTCGYQLRHVDIKNTQIEIKRLSGRMEWVKVGRWRGGGMEGVGGQMLLR